MVGAGRVDIKFDPALWREPDSKPELVLNSSTAERQ
jgi:hypothetical protein